MYVYIYIMYRCVYIYIYIYICRPAGSGLAEPGQLGVLAEMDYYHHNNNDDNNNSSCSLLCYMIHILL